MKIKDLPKTELPREKLQKYGVKKLTDHELLAVLLGSGVKGANVLNISRKVLSIVSKTGRDKIAFDNFKSIRGLGLVRIAQVMAVMELCSRLSNGKKHEIATAEDIWKLAVDFRSSRREHVVVFYLDIQHCLIERQIISIGTLSTSLVHPREIFEPAIVMHAASLIVVHNHPSGDVEPSLEDREVTARLVESGQILGINVSDHIIVSRAGWMSFKEKKLLR